MIFAFILLAIILIVLAFLFTSIKIKIEYSDSLIVKFYFGVFKIPDNLLNKTEKKKNKSKSKEKAKNKNKNQKFIDKIKRKGFYNAFSEVVQFLSPTLKELERFLKRVTINPLQINIKMVGEDAADLAVDYGKFCAIYYPILKAIESKTNCKNIQSNVYVDYVAKRSEIYFKTELKVRLIYGVVSGFKIILLFLKFKENFK